MKRLRHGAAAVKRTGEKNQRLFSIELHEQGGRGVVSF